MPSRVKGERLSMARYVTVVLRLLVDRRGQLEHGEVAGVERLEAPRRFKGEWGGPISVWAIRHLAALGVEPAALIGDEE